MCYFTTVPASTPLPTSFPHSPSEHLLHEMTMEHETQTDKPPQCKDAQPSPPPVRRSRRLAAKPLKTANAPGTMGEPRRNPKRKASEATNEANHAISKESGQLLLNEALAPLSQEDIQEWEGWIALESEPAFFNIILRDLGVKDVKAQEIFTIDQDSLALLPQPVYGLIFLFQYVPGYDQVNEEEDISDVWFANQTTDNACATVAMLNIVMNADGLDLGDKLQDFKESTRHLNTALRGRQLSKNTFIRTIHNSFTRRMDHLNADLCLENEISEAKTTKTRKRAAPRKGKRAPTRKKKVKSDYGFHFIAYVPAGGYVWELDGLQSKPNRLDPVPEGGDWTTVARPQIEGRMLQYEENQLSFNLLALCRSPLSAHTQTIARAAASLHHLHTQIQPDSTFSELTSAESNPLDIRDESRLAEFNLKPKDITSLDISEDLRAKIKQPDFDTSAAYELHQELVIEVKAAMGEYRAELMSKADDEQRVKGRKKDFGPALHKWMTKLAEKGVLEDVIKAS
ncbi:hypothetical protein B0J15DRAFT_164448 [Fusarium solani]|uniref:Ubiquitin carboxyl-terminal hydrolase n=1 Tax=Fusarium solani TaxID=169388 RepID=A0A9P9L0L1_FUSSL|nr:uncharacterized protein B0J15DRAFT_164448 [Fusarium solani]KAH7271994.1 hypothetical protein B0J15DRAFT_164448 [Fusarium solani]